jgi:hypothetical protein
METDPGCLLNEPEKSLLQGCSHLFGVRLKSSCIIEQGGGRYSELLSHKRVLASLVSAV